MGLPVVTVASGGLPVADATASGRGVPVDEASNGRGIAVTKVASGGAMAVVYSTPQQVVVGGDTVGQPGTGINTAYTLSWAQDFNAMSSDLVSPSNPRGQIFPTGGYHAIRNPGGAGGALSTSCDVDPYWTGYNDSNRGVAVGFTNMSQIAASVLRLQARVSSGGERPHLVPTDPSINGGVRPQVSAMIHGAGAFGYYPAAGSPVRLEARMRCTNKTGNPVGWHPSFWTYALTTLTGGTGNEWDIEGTSQSFGARYNEHTSGSISSSGGFGSAINTMDDNWHVYTFDFAPGDAVRVYLDGVQVAGQTSGAGTDANSKSMPSTFLLTSHVYNGTFGSDTYSQAAWDGDPDGASMDVDWIKGWRLTASTAKHWKPLASQADVNVAYNGTTSIVLPSALTLWGDATVTEYVQVVPYDGLEPGMDYTSQPYVGLPTGITYNSGTRTISVDFSAGTGNAGRCHVAVYGWKPDGSTMEPLRFAINRGPNVKTTNQSLTIGTAYSRDIYADCDCGVLLPKTGITVSGLPAGLSFNSSTGLITGTPTTAQAPTVTIGCTNSIGQTTSKGVTFSVAASNVTRALLDHSELNTTGTVYTSNTINFAATDRVCAFVQGRISGVGTNPTCTAVLNKTGGGTVTGTVVGSIANVNANIDKIYIFDFGPAGVTSGTITATWSASMLRAGIVSYKVTGAANVAPSGSAVALDNVANGTAVQSTINVAVASNGIALFAGSITSSAAPTTAWTGANGDVASTLIGGTIYHASGSDISGVSGTNAYTLRFNGTTSPINMVFGGVAYGP